MEAQRQIVAFGGGGFSMERGNPLLDEYVLGLARGERPRVCFLPTASGDADHYIVRFYNAFPASRCEPSHVSLFRRETGVGDIHQHLLAQDLIYVGGGSVISMLGAWHAHGLDRTLRAAWESGTVLCGLSAGSLCWFEEGVAAFHGEATKVHGLGLLPGSNSVHYDGERSRGCAYRRMLLDGMAPGLAAEDGTGLHFVGPQLERVVSSRPGARAFRMRRVNGRVVKTALPAEYLGDDAPVRAAAARTEVGGRAAPAAAGMGDPVVMAA